MGMRIVYVVGAVSGEKPVKVGVTQSIKQRLKGLQTGCPVKLKVYHAVRVRDWAAQNIERAAHHKLRPFRTHGEWFDVTPDEALAVIVKAAPEHIARARMMHGHMKNWLDTICAEHGLEFEDRLSIELYEDWARTNRGLMKAANAFVTKLHGMGATALLGHVIIEHKSVREIFRREPTAAKKADKAFRAAVAALSDYRAFRREQSLLDEILGMGV